MSSRYFHVTEHIVPGQYVREYADNLRENQADTLRLHVKQYTPRRPAADGLTLVTVVGTHGNGFPKEASEALWDELLSRAERAGFGIRDVWIADAAHEGQSYVLNQDRLSYDVSWLDHPRDLLLIINHFRGQMKRPIVGIGHSFGAAQLVYMSSFHPRLMDGLVLLDPVTQPELDSSAFYPPQQSLAYLSTYRRDIWPTRKEAAVSIRRAPMYACWDDRAWEAFVRHGLRDLPTPLHPELPPGASPSDPPVTLTTPPLMEVQTFWRANFEGRDASGKLVADRRTHPDVRIDGKGLSPYPFYRPEPTIVWNKLPELRPPTLFVLGADSPLMGRGTRDAHKITGLAVGGSGGEEAGRVKRVVLPGVGHGVPFEAPIAAAEACAPWIGALVREWTADEEAWRSRQRSRPARDHVAPSDEWKRHIGPEPKRQPKKTGSKM